MEGGGGEVGRFKMRQQMPAAHKWDLLVLTCCLDLS